MEKRKEYCAKALANIKAHNEHKHQIYKLGVDLNELGDTLTTTIEEGIALLLSTGEQNNKHAFDLISWWLYERVPKVIWLDERTVERNVEDVNDLLDFIIEHYND